MALEGPAEKTLWMYHGMDDIYVAVFSFIKSTCSGFHHELNQIVMKFSLLYLNVHICALTPLY